MPQPMSITAAPQHPRADWTRLWRCLPLVAAMVFSLPLSAETNSLAKTQHGELNWKQEREFWAFQPPKPQSAPSVRRTNWPIQPMDFFVLAAMERQGLQPSPPADRIPLLRRATFDLTGLPPTPGEIQRFLADNQPGAWERQVDRLLNSPAFGERMASLWLPLVRYAEDQAHQVGDDTTYFYPNAWKYRQWVIQAFNRDLPYDRFLKFQLAADRFSMATDQDQAALGLLGLGPKYYDRGRLEVQAEEWEDRVDTVSRTMLGLTVACARCHDHKFEPITTTDYYALAGIFASSRMVNQTPSGYVEKDGTPSPKIQRDTMHVVKEDKPRDLNVFLRGNVDRKGPVAERRFLRILGDDTAERFVDGSGRRELAEAIASPSNPLTARVWVNRVWNEFFGKPLVASPSNFGHSGSRPTHPELLDDLAVRFMANGWSVKALIREFVVSATYRQHSATASTPDSIAKPGVTSSAGTDPENTWLARMPRRRLSIEQWRDALLFVSGDLVPSDGRSRDLAESTNHFRTVHGRISRLKLDDTLMQFDYPDANVHSEKRSTTTTAMQKLFVLNHPFMLERADALAHRASEAAGGDSESRIRWLYQTLYSRDPLAAEIDLGKRFLEANRSDAAKAWQRYSQVLLSANEFQYTD